MDSSSKREAAKQTMYFWLSSNVESDREAVSGLSRLIDLPQFVHSMLLSLENSNRK